MISKLKYTVVFPLIIFLSACQTLPSQEGGVTKPAQIDEILIVISNIISLLAPLALIIFFMMLIYGGFQLMGSGGDQKAVAAARSTMLYAVLGLILVVVVWLLLLLIGFITTVNITNVELPFGEDDNSVPSDFGDVQF